MKPSRSSCSCTSGGECSLLRSSGVGFVSVFSVNGNSLCHLFTSRFLSRRLVSVFFLFLLPSSPASYVSALYCELRNCTENTKREIESETQGLLHNFPFCLVMGIRVPGMVQGPSLFAGICFVFLVLCAISPVAPVVPQGSSSSPLPLPLQLPTDLCPNILVP